ncbi:response regulator [Stutzerimonas zhaodongensis]|uniref:histidine kinase n=1 Tax=Stutzerimonas zhaodongensis TaxID=1176257 RepID=A0A3M2I019_9GAMM|nr:CHASE domain-containing protein [Stutzerimonas zhaodongensis]MCQ4315652.1 CHASE domain-containing protein [Stutzerimonas zhaodongensis]RMH91484.1 response regulator [Stutzerimonas zhaodongensis]
MSETATDASSDKMRQVFHWRNGVAWLVLAFALLVQLALLHHLERKEERAALKQFDLLVQTTTETIRKRMVDHEQILLGAAGMFDGSDEVTRDQWRNYNERLQLSERYPGIQGVGFAKTVPQAELATHVQSVRAEGLSDYDVAPPGNRDLYTPIVYLEPFNERNRAAFGYDMFAEPIRRQAMLTAAETGETQITGKVTLRQEIYREVQAGILMYAPLYTPGEPLDTPAQRLDALYGFVFSPFRLDDLMRGILGVNANLNLHIYAGESESVEQMLYASREGEATEEPKYSQVAKLQLYGQTWTLRLESRPAFDQFFHSNKSLIVGLGTGLSALLFFLTLSLSMRRSRAESLAQQMTEHILENKRALQLSEERLSLALKGSNDGLWDLNLDIGTFYASPRAWHMLGYRPGELSSDLKLWERVMVAEDLPKARAQLARTMLSKVDHFTAELRLQHKSGKVTPVLVRGYIQRDRSGQPLRISGTSMDLTEHKRIEQMKDEFVSTVSHELRTPLTSISGALGLITAGALGESPPAIQQMLEIAHRNSLRLGYLINDLLDMEKITAGKMTFDMREHSLRRLLDEALISNQAFAAHYGVNCILREPANVNVWVDGLRLQQVLTNFLSNAIKYTPEGGEVTLHCSQPDGGHVRISVTDQGPGIPPTFQTRVFEKFAQADASDSRQKGGTGLGLAITKEFIERMGGRVGFDTAEGNGTTFWCELPIVETATLTPDQGQPRLLVIEDEPDTGRLLHLMLRDAGYAVDRVQSLHAARGKLAGTRYEAMTLDMHLPDGSGRDLIDEVRNNLDTRNLPIIVISAASQFDRHPDDRNIAWLHKPISAAQLLIALTDSLESNRHPS